MVHYYCDLCGNGTFLRKTGDDRFCPICRSLRPIEKCRKSPPEEDC